VNGFHLYIIADFISQWAKSVALDCENNDTLYQSYNKGKVIPCAYLTTHYAVKAYGRSGYINPYFLDLGTSLR
jgi:hypothetical protein